MVHEIGHAVGFHHEQNRPDRDDHITILVENISPGVRYNFKKYSTTAVNTYDVPYDYSSVMHYGGKYFSNNNGYTIKTRDSRYQNVIGNREGLSFYDVMIANRMLQCDKRCEPKTKCPPGSYRGKDCQCYCQGSDVVKVCNRETPRTTTAPPTVQTTEPIIKNCMDQYRNCAGWAAGNYCETNTNVRKYCQKSCNLCGVVGVECKDEQRTSWCSGWKQRGYCEGVYSAYMSSNCRKTCGKCETGVPRRRNVGYTGQAQENKGEATAKLSYIIVVTVVLSAVVIFL